MATASSVISVAIVGDSRKFQKAVGGAEKKVGGFGSSIKSAAVGIGAALAGLFAVSKAFDFLGDSLNEADRAGDALGNLERIVGKINTKKIDDAADGFHDLGLASTDVLELSVGFARIARAIGLRPQLIANYADDVASIAKAMSLVDEKGRDAAFWVEAISKAASKPGGGKPGQVLGIKINEVRVIADALERTGKASADLLTPAEISAARFLQIIRKLGPEVAKALADPDLEQTQEAIQADIRELQRQIGEGLSPVIRDLLMNLRDISQSEWVADMLEGVEVVKAAIPGLVTDFTEGFDLVNASISEDFQQIMDGAGELGASIGTAFGKMADDVGNFIGTVGGALDAVIRFVTDTKAILGGIADLINDIFGSDHSATFQVNVGRAGGSVPGRGGDRATSDAVRREAERNGQSRIGRDNT